MTYSDRINLANVLINMQILDIVSKNHALTEQMVRLLSEIAQQKRTDDVQ